MMSQRSQTREVRLKVYWESGTTKTTVTRLQAQASDRTSESQMDRMFGLYTGRRAMACLIVAMPVKVIKKMRMVNASTSVRTCQWLCHMLWIHITNDFLDYYSLDSVLTL
jgi:hypothetical protein